MAPPPLPHPSSTPATSATGNRVLRRAQQRSASFNGRSEMDSADRRGIRRPKTQPDLIPAGWRIGGGGGGGNSPAKDRRVPARVLVNVAVHRSLGPIQVMASLEWRAEDLVAAAVKTYVKEGRRPPLPSTEPSDFGLHYSQFSLESLDSKEKPIELGSRNFFLCPKFISATTTVALSAATATSPYPNSPPSASCSREAEKPTKRANCWLRFIDFLL